MPVLRLRFLVACAIVALSLSLGASSPKFFVAATQADFLKGDLDNLSVDSRGELALGPATEVAYESTAPFLWAVQGQPDGTLYVGTGNEGQVFKIDGSGRATVFFDSPELEVHALAPAPNGGLYVGTSPDGRIYQVDRDGNGKPFFSNDDKYIWAIVVDGHGNLFAGTGDKGIVYKITPDGNSVPFYKTNATHATALAFDRAGNLLVGTSSPGRVVRVSPDGKGFVLLDSPFQEIRSLRLDEKGVLYVAALNGRNASGGGPATTDTDRRPTDAARAPVPSVSAEITSIAIVDVGGGPTQATAPREDRRTAKGAVYRIQTDGVWDQIWESRDDSPYDLAFDQTGALLIGTGNKGKLYRLEGEPVRPTLLTSAGAQQITAFYKDPRGRLLYATANPGKLFRLATGRATRGTYESDSRDAGMVATWGTLSWHGSTPPGTRIELFTRSGNTETPDDTWSEWSAAYQKSDGSQVTSPKARYLQWRAVLTGQGAGPVLTSVSAAYLQRNIRPQVRSITIHPPGIVFQKPFSTGDPELAGFDDQSTPDRKLASQAASQGSGGSASPALGRRTYQKGLQTIVWRADDENDDELVYDVLYRREGETTWKTLRKGIQDTILVWDTTTVPNGTYFVRVVASDSPTNAPAQALAGEMDSVAFEIDNTPPSITIGSVREENGRTIIAFEVTDDHSPIQRVEFSKDGQHWRSVFPVDGIADSKSERYQLTLDGDAGERGVTLRAADSMNNVTSAQVQRPRRP